MIGRRRGKDAENADEPVDDVMPDEAEGLSPRERGPWEEPRP